MISLNCLTLNMARQGFFGEIIHTEGAYIHDLLDMQFLQKKLLRHVAVERKLYEMEALSNPWTWSDSAGA